VNNYKIQPICSVHIVPVDLVDENIVPMVESKQKNSFASDVC